MSTHCDAKIFRRAMAAAVSGVSVVTTDGPSGRFGVTVSSLASISLEPPIVMVSLQNRSPALSAIRDHGSCAINILSAEQSVISDVFAGRGPGGARHDFNFGAWAKGVNGAPLLDKCIAALECRVWHTMPVHDHTLIFGLVEASTMEPGPEVPGDVPLAFWRGAYGRPQHIWQGNAA